MIAGPEDVTAARAEQAAWVNRVARARTTESRHTLGFNPNLLLEGTEVERISGKGTTNRRVRYFVAN